MIDSHEFLRLGWTQFWQISLLIPIVAILCRTILRKYPYLCRGLWVIVLMKCLVPPVFPSVFGVFSWSQVRLREVEIFSTGSVADRFNESFTAIATGGWLPWIATAWLFGAAVYLVSVIVRIRNFQRIVAESKVETPLAVQRAIDFFQRSAPDVPLRVAVVDQPLGPAVMGIRKPIIVLPATVVESKSEADLRLMIAHEMLHVRRGDTLIAFLQLLVQLVWWFHPMTWLATRDCSLQGELCCDREVLSLLGCSRKAYANCLVDVIEAKCRLQPILGTPGMRAAEMTRHRLSSIVDVSDSEIRGYRPRWVIPIWAVVMAMIILPGKGIEVSAEWLHPIYQISPEALENAECLPPDFVVDESIASGVE